MKRKFIAPAGEKSQGIDALKGTRTGAAYADAVRIDLADHTLLFISGKTGTKDGKLVGRTMTEQTRQVIENIKTTLEGQGGSLGDIVRFRIYVTQIDPESIRDVHAVRAEYFKEGEFPASTLVRVDQLVRDGGLIEIEADVVMARQ
jgi:enamine deaminase RidA (YjgF/YER057c/UK114 family)